MIFLKENTFFALFCQKFEKYLIRLKNKKSVPRHVFLRDFPEIWEFLTQSYFGSLSQKFLTKKVVFCHFLKKSSFLVQFDIKNGFSDSFPFQKCTLL